MDQAKRFFALCALFAVSLAVFCLVLGVVDLTSGGGTITGALLLVAGAWSLVAARSAWKIRDRVPDQPPAPTAEERRRSMRWLIGVLIAFWVVTFGIMYAVDGLVFALIVGGIGGISLVIGLLLGKRLTDRWSAAPRSRRLE